MPNFNIDILEVSKIFTSHFEAKNNNRILFSGPYGCGKTFFLKEFFEKREAKYNVFRLVPVDYSVSNNEDIFEYIKVDISKQLLPYFPAETQEKFSNILMLQQYISSSPIKILGSVLASTKIKFSPKPFIDVEFDLKDIYNKFDEFKASINKSIYAENTHKILSKPIETQTSKVGSIFKDDILTQTIRASINFLKEEYKKENVLIIDDVDRLDPEHIFRLLNILSAHNNHWGSDNKFDFDKIIIVCDFANIEKIFHHKYGKGVDFEGYIDKFYSRDIFHFSNKDAIDLFCQTRFKDKDELDVSNLEVLSKILLYLNKDNLLSVRKLRKLEFDISISQEMIYDDFPDFSNWRFSYIHSSRPNVKPGKICYNPTDFKFLKVLRILTTIFGGYEGLKKSISDLKVKYNKSEEDFLSEVQVVNSIGLLDHICISESRFFTKEYRDPNRNSIDRINYPKYYDFFIILPWFDGIYTGTGKRGEEYELSKSYFTEHSFFIDPIPGPRDQNKMITDSEFFNRLYTLVNKLQENKALFAALGATCSDGSTSAGMVR